MKLYQSILRELNIFSLFFTDCLFAVSYLSCISVWEQELESKFVTWAESISDQSYTNQEFSDKVCDWLYETDDARDWFVIVLDSQNHPHNIKIKNKNGFNVTKDGRKVIVGSRSKFTKHVQHVVEVRQKMYEVSTKWCGFCRSWLNPYHPCCGNRMCDRKLADLTPLLPQEVDILGVINLTFNVAVTGCIGTSRFIAEQRWGHTVDYVLYAFV